MSEEADRLFDDVVDKTKAAQQCLYEAAAVIGYNHKAEMQSQFITLKERKEMFLFTFLRFA